MTALETIRWVLAFARNSHNGGDAYTDAELSLAAEYMNRGEDPWESAAAISEGRDIARSSESAVCGETEIAALRAAGLDVELDNNGQE